MGAQSRAGARRQATPARTIASPTAHPQLARRCSSMRWTDAPGPGQPGAASRQQRHPSRSGSDSVVSPRIETLGVASPRQLVTDWNRSERS